MGIFASEGYCEDGFAPGLAHSRCSPNVSSGSGLKDLGKASFLTVSNRVESRKSGGAAGVGRPSSLPQSLPTSLCSGHSFRDRSPVPRWSGLLSASTPPIGYSFSLRVPHLSRYWPRGLFRGNLPWESFIFPASSVASVSSSIKRE